MSAHPDVEKGLTGLVVLTKTLIEIGTNKKFKQGIKGIIYMSKKLDPAAGQSIADFLVAITDPIKNPKEFQKRMVAVVNSILMLKHINILTALNIWMASKLLNGKTGKALAKFVETLVSPLDKFKDSTVKHAGKVIEAVGNMLLKISFAIGILTALVALDLKSTLIAAGIVVGIIVILLGLA